MTLSLEDQVRALRHVLHLVATQNHMKHGIIVDKTYLECSNNVCSTARLAMEATIPTTEDQIEPIDIRSARRARVQGGRLNMEGPHDGA